MFNKVVVRDRAWFAGTAEKRAELWNKVEEIRAGIIVPAPKRAKIVKEIVNVCKISDD